MALDDNGQVSTWFHDRNAEGDGPGPEYDSSIKLCHIVLLKANTAKVNNVTGGTELPGEGERYYQHPAMRVMVTKLWWDYECGYRYVGHIMDMAKIRGIDKQLDWTRKLDEDVPARATEERLERVFAVQTGWLEYAPNKVYFSEGDAAMNLGELTSLIDMAEAGGKQAAAEEFETEKNQDKNDLCDSLEALKDKVDRLIEDNRLFH